MLTFESEDDSWTFPLLENEDITMLPTAALLNANGTTRVHLSRTLWLHI